MSVDRQQLADQVYTIVAELARIKREEIKGNDRLREDLGLDSMQSMELLSRVSEEFDVDPDMEQINLVTTVDGVITLLASTLDQA